MHDHAVKWESFIRILFYMFFLTFFICKLKWTFVVLHADECMVSTDGLNEAYTCNTLGTPGDLNCNLDVPAWVTGRSVCWQMTLFIDIGSSSRLGGGTGAISPPPPTQIFGGAIAPLAPPPRFLRLCY